MTLDDFRRLPIAPGTAHVQPTGRVLVNKPTNVYVEAAPQTLATQLVGFPVQVRATPSDFVWDFGDGATLPTSDAGAAYPDLRTTHTYTRTGRANVGLTTRFTGEYSVAGGPWQGIVGTADVASAPVPLQVLQARAVLVSP